VPQPAASAAAADIVVPMVTVYPCLTDLFFLDVSDVAVFDSDAFTILLLLLVLIVINQSISLFRVKQHNH